MARSPHLESLIGSLDQAIYASFACAYILDGNLLNLVIRIISQLQFSSPKTHHPDRSLRFHMGACLFLNIMSLLYHLLVPFPNRPRGIIIDFIGLPSTPSVLKVFTVDVVTAFLQALMLLLAYETAHYGKEAILDDSSEDGEADDGQQEAAQDEGVDDGADGVSVSPPPPKDHEYDRPIINLRFKHTLSRISNNKPYTTATPGSEDADEARALLIRRIRARIRQRQLAGETGDLQDGTSESNARLDERSDEEREIGFSRPSR